MAFDVLLHLRPEIGGGDVVGRVAAIQDDSQSEDNEDEEDAEDEVTAFQSK